MKKLRTMLASMAVLPVLVLGGTASADTFYSNIGGGNIFQSKNLTQNGSYNDPTSASCNDVVRFRLYLHNAGPETADSVSVKVSFPANASTKHVVTATATPNNADPRYPSVSDTATVNTGKTTTLKYVPGSAEYFGNNGSRLGSMSDNIVTTGADLPGGLGVSLNNARYVALNAKLNCVTTPPTEEEPEECKPGIPVGDKRCDTKTVTTPPTKTTTLTATGPGEVAALFAAAVAIGTAAYAWVLRRQNAR